MVFFFCLVFGPALLPSLLPSFFASFLGPLFCPPFGVRFWIRFLVLAPAGCPKAVVVNDYNNILKYMSQPSQGPFWALKTGTTSARPKVVVGTDLKYISKKMSQPSKGPFWAPKTGTTSACPKAVVGTAPTISEMGPKIAQKSNGKRAVLRTAQISGKFWPG